MGNSTIWIIVIIMIIEDIFRKVFKKKLNMPKGNA